MGTRNHKIRGVASSVGVLLTIDSLEKAPCGVDGQVARGPLLCSLRSWPVHDRPPSLSLVKVRLVNLAAFFHFLTSTLSIFALSSRERLLLFSLF